MSSSIESFEKLLSNLNPIVAEKPIKKTMSLVNFIESQNVEAVRTQLEKTSKNISTSSVIQALLNNFNPQIADMLLDKGLSFDKWWKDGQLGFELTSPITQWLLTNPKVDTNFLEGVFGEAVLSVALDLSDAHKLELASFVVRLHKKYPHICETAAEDYCVLLNCLEMQKEPTGQQWEMLQCLSQETWEREIIDISISNIKQMQNLLNLCKNIPLLNTVLINSFKHAHKTHQWLNQAVESPDGSLEKSILCSIKDKSSHLSGVLQTEMNNYNVFEELNLPPNLNLILSAYRLKNSYKIMEVPELKKLCDVEEYKSFLHILLYSCGANAVHFLKTNQEVENQVFDTFNSLDVSKFVSQSTPRDLQKFLTAFPTLLDWKDVAGNNLGHYMAISYSSNWRHNKEALKLIFTHPSLRQSNPYGVNPRNLLEKQFDPLVFAAYDKKNIKSKLKEKQLIGNSPKASKRKM